VIMHYVWPSDLDCKTLSSEKPCLRVCFCLFSSFFSLLVFPDFFFVSFFVSLFLLIMKSPNKKAPPGERLDLPAFKRRELKAQGA
jgi:hypothetical protein